MKKILIIAAAVVVAGGAALYFFVLRPKPEPVVITAYYSPGEYFVTNVRESTYVLKSSVVLVLNADTLDEALAKDNALIRDTIIFLLRDLTEEDIRDEGNKDELRNRILTELNKRLGIDNIVEVLFNDFVIA